MHGFDPRRRLLTLVAGLVVLVVALCACGTDDSSSVPSASATGAPGTPGPGATQAPAVPGAITSPLGRDGQVDPQLVGPDPDATAYANPAGRTDSARPNVVFVLTDDMTYSDLQYMPITRKLLGAQGVSFDRALSPHPLCCPARAAILTGQYAQNNGVKSNQDPWNYQSLQAGTALPVWLHRAGYRTGFTGKYINGFGTDGPRQPGWDYWDPTTFGMYNYQRYVMWQNGHPHEYDGLNNVDYINRRADSLIDQWAPQAQPFFLWVSQVAPHGRITRSEGRQHETAAPLPPARYRRDFRHTDSPSLRDPAFDEADISDKGPYVHRYGTVYTKAHIDDVFRARIQSLQGVDQGVGQIVAHLKAAHALHDTYIVFTSDNGFTMGEHRTESKNIPYAQSIHVPLLMRGPGLPRGVHRRQRAEMIDLGPTFAAIANAAPLVKVDGRSLLGVARRDATARGTVLIQAGPADRQGITGPDGWWWRGVTTERYTYARYLGDHYTELYDHEYDPAELQNVAGDPAYAAVQRELARRTAVLGTCAGVAQCSQGFGPVVQPHFTRGDPPPHPGHPKPATPPGGRAHDPGPRNDGD